VAPQQPVLPSDRLPVLLTVEAPERTRRGSAFSDRRICVTVALETVRT